MSPVSIPHRERKWIDINPATHSQGCFEVIRLFRHDDTVHREDDGAVRFDDVEEFKAKFDGTSQWPINDWITCLQREEDQRKGLNIA